MRRGQTSARPRRGKIMHHCEFPLWVYNSRIELFDAHRRYVCIDAVSTVAGHESVCGWLPSCLPNHAWAALRRGWNYWMKKNDLWCLQTASSRRRRTPICRPTAMTRCPGRPRGARSKARLSIRAAPVKASPANGFTTCKSRFNAHNSSISTCRSAHNAICRTLGNHITRRSVVHFVQGQPMET